MLPAEPITSAEYNLGPVAEDRAPDYERAAQYFRLANEQVDHDPVLLDLDLNGLVRINRIVLRRNMRLDPEHFDYDCE